MSGKRSYPRTMKAVFIGKPGGPLEMKEVNIPEPGPNEVLIKMAAAPVNPSDLLRLKIINPAAEHNGFIPGLEGSGTVIASGKGLLPGLWMGKRVACSAGQASGGTWAEYMVTQAGRCFPLGKKVTDEQGSMSLVNPLTALAFFEIVKQNGHKALINNAAGSALGRMVELLGNKKGIPVINIVRSRQQHDLLKSQGSKYVLDSSDPSFAESLAVLAAQLKATVLFDSVCSRQLESIIDALPNKSAVFIYGNLSGEKEIMVNPRSLIEKDLNLSGFYLANRAEENGLIKNMLNILKVGRLMSSDMKIKIQARFPLERAQEAIDAYLGNMSAGKVLLVPSIIK